MIDTIYSDPNYLAHYGVKGMKWGVRRYQNTDGSLTEDGYSRYYTDGHLNKYGKRAKDKAKSTNSYGQVSNTLGSIGRAYSVHQANKVLALAGGAAVAYANRGRIGYNTGRLAVASILGTMGAITIGSAVDIVDRHQRRYRYDHDPIYKKQTIARAKLPNTMSRAKFENSRNSTK